MVIAGQQNAESHCPELSGVTGWQCSKKLLGRTWVRAATFTMGCTAQSPSGSTVSRAQCNEGSMSQMTECTTNSSWGPAAHRVFCSEKWAGRMTNCAVTLGNLLFQGAFGVRTARTEYQTLVHKFPGNACTLQLLEVSVMNAAMLEHTTWNLQDTRKSRVCSYYGPSPRRSVHIKH